MIKKSLQDSYARWVAEGKQPDWWDGLAESMLEVNFYKEDAVNRGLDSYKEDSPLKVCVYQNYDVTDWVETKTDRWVDVTRWLRHKEVRA